MPRALWCVSVGGGVSYEQGTTVDKQRHVKDLHGSGHGRSDRKRDSIFKILAMNFTTQHDLYE